MQIVKGKDFRLFFLDEETGEFNSFYHAISCSLSFDTIFTGIVTKRTGGGEEDLPERIVWNVSGNGLMVHQATPNANFLELWNIWEKRQKVFISCDLSDNYQEPISVLGEAYIQHLDVEANADGNAVANFELKGQRIPKISRRKINPDDLQGIFDITFDITLE